MSIKYNELSLSEVIEESNLILEVEFLEVYKEEIPITKADSAITSASEIVPPFIKKSNVFTVTKILKNSGGIKVPERIEVPEEDWRRSLSKHKEKYLKAPAKSYTVSEYRSKVKSISKASLLFLHHFQNLYELTARNAFEDERALDKISILIHNAD
jgi:hypothetical protein